MVCGSGVNNVGSGVGRHVAVDAAVLSALAEALGHRQTTPPALLVALQAGGAVVLDTSRWLNALVRIMAGDTAQPVFPVTGLKAAALVHLLDMADSLRAFPPLRCGDEHRPELLHRQAGAEVVQPAAVAHEPSFPLQVALLADGLAERRRQVPRVDDRVLFRATAGHVEFARP